MTKNYIQEKDILDLINKNGLEKVLLNYLTYRYNYDRKFQDAKYNEKGNPTNKAAELRQKFEGQKPEDVIDGLFENWKLDNPTLINDNIVKRFKQIIYMLSNYTYSKYAINKGYNDDVKLFSPYYLELISNPREEKTGYWVFENCKVELNSMYFNFSSSGPIPPEPVNYWEEVYSNEKPFNQVDNKYYFVVWHGYEKNDWRIIKFKNTIATMKIDNNDNRQLEKTDLGVSMGKSLYITNQSGIIKYVTTWPKDDGTYFKSVYRWNNDSEPNTPFISPKTG